MSMNQCSERVWDRFTDYPCSRVAQKEEGGAWWCTQHLPSKARARRLAAEQREKAQFDVRMHQVYASSICARLSVERLQELCTAGFRLTEERVGRLQSLEVK